MQNQNQMLLFPSHNAVVVSTSSTARVCGHSQLCDSSRHLLLRLLQRHPGAIRAYTGWLAGWLLRLAGKQQQRSEATNQICGFGAPPQTEATKLAPTLMTAAAHHAVVNKFFFSFLAFFPFFGVYEPNNTPMCFGKDKCNFRQVFCVFIYFSNG